MSKVALLIALLFPLFLGPQSIAGESWEYARTDHFDVYSTCSRKETEKHIRNLELFRSWFFLRFNGSNPYIPRTAVLCLDSYSDLEPYLRSYGNQKIGAAGFFLYPLSCPAIMLRADHGTPETRQTIFHEFTHLMVLGLMPNAPLWFNEGLAQAFETARVSKSKFLVGEHEQNRANIVAHQGLMPLGRLFNIKQDSPEYNKGPNRDLYYAGTWELAHLCLFGKPQLYRDKYMFFASQIALGMVPSEQRFKAIFGMDFKEMENVLREYNKDGDYLISSTPVSDLKIPAIAFLPEVVSDRECILKCILARVHADKSDPMHDCVDETMRLLKWEFSTENPFVATFAAMTARALNEDQIAEPLERRAVDLNTDNATIYVLQAGRLLDQIGYDLEYRIPKDTYIMERAIIERGLALDPQNDDLLIHLAHIESASDECRYTEIDRLQKQVAKMGKRDSALFFLAVARLRQKDYKMCDAMLYILENSVNSVPRGAVSSLRSALDKADPPSKAESAKSVKSPAGGAAR